MRGPGRAAWERNVGGAAIHATRGPELGRGHGRRWQDEGGGQQESCSTVEACYRTGPRRTSFAPLFLHLFCRTGAVRASTRTGAVLSVLDCNTSDLEWGGGRSPCGPGRRVADRQRRVLERLARWTRGGGRESLIKRE